MSYLWDANGERLIRTASVPVTGTPFTVAGWFKVPTLGPTDTLINIGTDASTLNMFEIRLISNTVSIRVADGTSTEAAQTSTSIDTTDQWYHACAICASSTDRKVYLDGGGEGADTIARVPTGIDSIRFGERADGGQDFRGNMAYWTIWDVAITAGQLASLAGGADPATVDPTNQVAYWPMVADALDDVGTYDLTVEGATLDSGDDPTLTSGGLPGYHGANRGILRGVGRGVG